MSRRFMSHWRVSRSPTCPPVYLVKRLIFRVADILNATPQIVNKGPHVQRIVRAICPSNLLSAIKKREVGRLFKPLMPMSLFSQNPPRCGKA